MHICTRKTVKTACNKEDFVAQLVEQLTLNQWAVGSSPTEVTEDKRLTFVSGFLFWVKPSIMGSPEKLGGAALVFSKKNNVCHHFVTYIFVTLCDKIKNRSFYD